MRARVHNIPRRLGRVFTEAGFLIATDPDTVRAPDVAFISAGRIPVGGLPAYFPGAPDIAIEVSPSSSEPEAVARALTWLEAGSAAVWMLYPDSRSVKVYRPSRNVAALEADDATFSTPRRSWSDFLWKYPTFSRSPNVFTPS